MTIAQNVGEGSESSASMTPYDYWADIHIKLPVHQLVDHGRTFVVKVSGYDCLLNLQESPQPFFPVPGVQEIANVELKYDRHGLTRAMDALIRLPGPLLAIQPDEIRVEGIGKSDRGPDVLDVALVVINKFIDAYRFLSGEFHIRRLAQSDLIGMWNVAVDWFRDSHYVVSSVSALLGPGMTLARNPAPDAFQTELQQWLFESQIPLHGLLFLNARAHLESGDYRMAVIDSRSSLEVLVDDLLNQAFAGAPTDRVRETLNVKGRSEGFGLQQVIRSAKINDKLKHGLRSAVGKSPADNSRLWRRWLAVKRVREETVHYGQDVNRRQATDHIAVVEEIRTLLSVFGVSENWKVTYVPTGSFTTQWLSG